MPPRAASFSVAHNDLHSLSARLDRVERHAHHATSSLRSGAGEVDAKAFGAPGRRSD